MAAGSATEPEARAFYELEAGADVLEVGACLSDCERWSCSPDGLVGDDGGLELKCVQPKTQAKYLLDDGASLLADYRTQVHGCLLVTGRKWWHLMSYCAGLNPVLIRITEDAYTAALRKALDEFWDKYQSALKKLGIIGETK